MMSTRQNALKAADVILCGLVCLAGLAITFLVLTLFERSEQRTVSVAFQLEVDERFSRLQRRFNTQVLKLDVVRRFFINADDVTEREFLGFVTPLVGEDESCGWVPRILEKDLQAFRAKALGNGTSDFSYHEMNPVTGERAPLTHRPEHLILLYLLKRDDVTIMPGMDVLARPGRQALMSKARETRQIAVSEPLEMTNGQSGIFFVAPVFRESRKASLNDDDLQGFVVSTVRLASLMEQGIPLPSLQRLNVALSLSDTQHQGETIYHSSTPAAPSGLYAQRLLKVADQNYLIQFRPSSTFLLSNSYALSTNLIIAFGAGLTLLLTSMVYMLITQRARALSLVDERTQDLRLLNITDHLTGVYNRRHFEELMESLLVEATVHYRPLSLIMFDVDHFKQINDRYGHQWGDNVLKSLCTRIRSATRKTDLLCRTGGEEFALICPDTELDDTRLLAEKLRALISNLPFDDIGQVTCSFGVATWTPSESFDAFVRRADTAMYRAKSSGRDQVQLAEV
ncbi:diguanylate cyclase (GGDEF) domain-containing protein [Pseudomonas asplenii]|uniref:diguanylate cyclase n=1 Tax=Pseudomonas asplenii TaxID=53407 RepID=A0A0N0VKH4_9PSED|nr:sensor domain-containing diguanylate cyclase [Pseudomonas fuscovaginae]KPA92100.1 diguanylate cyclase (GGDEF) domain-containing protein [Pseudomonas fuscovaginae]